MDTTAVLKEGPGSRGSKIYLYKDRQNTRYPRTRFVKYREKSTQTLPVTLFNKAQLVQCATLAKHRKTNGNSTAAKQGEGHFVYYHSLPDIIFIADSQMSPYWLDPGPVFTGFLGRCL